MNIDLTKLKMHHWFEDEEGNIYDGMHANLPDKDYFIYHMIEPCTFIENIDSYTCHPEYYHENNALYQALLHFKFFRNYMKRKHRKDKTFKRLCSLNTHYGKATQDCIVAMVNSGDYTLEEAIFICGSACERCMNVLLYKYLNGKDGYPEYSDEWKKCNTECAFCKESEKR